MNCIKYYSLVKSDKKPRVTFDRVVRYSKKPKYNLTTHIKCKCWWNCDDYEYFANCFKLARENARRRKVSFNIRVSYSVIPKYEITPRMLRKCWWDFQDYESFMNYAILNSRSKIKSG